MKQWEKEKARQCRVSLGDAFRGVGTYVADWRQERRGRERWGRSVMESPFHRSRCDAGEHLPVD